MLVRTHTHMHMHMHTHTCTHTSARTHTQSNHKGTWKGVGVTGFHEKCERVTPEVPR